MRLRILALPLVLMVIAPMGALIDPNAGAVCAQRSGCNSHDNYWDAACEGGCDPDPYDFCVHPEFFEAAEEWTCADPSYGCELT